MNSPVIDGAAIAAPSAHRRAARRHQSPQLAGKDVLLESPNASKATSNGAGFKNALQVARFAQSEKLAANSPIMDGASIALRPRPQPAARRYQAQPLVTNRATAPASPAFPSDLKDPGLKESLQAARFGEAQGMLNSPIVGGAVIAARPSAN